MRITGGLFRSRTLEAPKGTSTRPTSDRVREALFSILAARIDFAGMRVLDLYAGTGALAFEALSRGAEHATLVEGRTEVVRVLQRNATALGVMPKVRVIASPVERARARLEPPYDLVFIDPPYADVREGRMAENLSHLADVWTGAHEIVLEHASGDAPPALTNAIFQSTRVYGDTALSFFRGSSAGA